MENKNKEDAPVKVAIITVIGTIIVALIALIPIIIDRESNTTPVSSNSNKTTIVNNFGKDEKPPHSNPNFHSTKERRGSEERENGNKNNLENKDDSELVEVVATLKKEGAILQNAYFTVEKYTSTITNKDGKATIRIPKNMYEKGIEYNFNVFSSENDSLLYDKLMKFSNLEFNKY